MKANIHPFFSVVIPVYNKEKYVSRTIQSVLAQDFEDFELIIVCDPSTDNSEHEVQKHKDSRIKIFYRDQPGPGGYAARNLGIQNSKGHWIAFLDADDVWLPNHLKKIKELSERHPDVNFLSCGWEWISKYGQVKDGYYINQEKKFYQSDKVIDLKEYLKLCIAGLRPVNSDVACVKKEALDSPHLFPESSGAKRGGDLHAWLEIMCTNKKMAWSSHIGAHYYLDVEGQVTKIAPSTPYLMSRESYHSLSANLNENEKVMLKKLFNIYLRGAWIGNAVRNNNNFNIRRFVYYRGDIFNAILIFHISFLPPFFFRSLKTIRAWIKYKY